MRHHRKLRAQHLVRTQRRHSAFEVGGGVDPVRPQAGDEVFLDMLQIAQLLVVVPGQQQCAVFELAFGDLAGRARGIAVRNSRCRA